MTDDGIRFRPSGWLRRTVAERQRDINEVVVDRATADLFTTDLVPTSRDGHCDCCGTPTAHVRAGAIGAIRGDGLHVLLDYRLCDDCWQRELPKATTRKGDHR